MINNSNRTRWDRLSAKDMDHQFVNEMLHGLNCSRFEAAAILEKVHEVYGPLFDCSGVIKPGQIQIMVIANTVAPNVPLAEARQQLVTLTMDTGSEDLKVRKEQGVIALRRRRLERMAVESFQQGGLMTVEDFAFRVFNCGICTILRDLSKLRKEGISIPLRSTVKDMGRAISHRKLIITQWLQGNEYSDIAKNSYHSIESVYNYVDKFKRAMLLVNEGFDIQTTSFLARISPSLAQEFASLYRHADMVEHRKAEIESCFKKNRLSQSQSKDLKKA
jgi:hypothetical protein